MSKSVSNDALWEKLSEIEEKINKHLKEQKTPVPIHQHDDVTSLLKVNKDEISELFRKGIQGLGTHCDSHFKTIYKNNEQSEKDIDGVYKILTCMSDILKESQEQSVIKSDDKKFYLNFKFFKLRKMSIVIVALGLLVVILTLFCMKQRSDYALLNKEYYEQGIEAKEDAERVGTYKK